MLDSIIAKNFQSWKDLNLKLSPGVNAIIGPSDSGKTAIFRALNWVINNRPLGDEFRSWWGGDTICRINLSENNWIERGKTDTDNYYNMKGYKEPDRGFNKAVPDDIKRALNITDINFRFQHDGPFMLSQTPGVNARYLNEIVNLNIIDRSLKNINERLRLEEYDFKKNNEDRDRLKEKLKEFDWLPETETIINEAEQASIEIEKTKNDFEILEFLSADLINTNQHLEKIDEILIFEKEIDDLINLDNEIEKLIDEEDELGSLFDDLTDINNKVDTANQFVKYEKEVNELIEINNKIQQLREQKINLHFAWDEFLTICKNIDEYNLLILRFENDLHELMPDRCPLCGMPTKQEKKK